MLSSFRNGGALRVCGASEPGTGCAPPQHTQGAHTLRAQAIPTTWAAWRRCAKSYGLRYVVVHMRCFRLSIFAPALHQESVPTPRGRLLQPASSHKVKLQRMRTKFVHSRFKLDELFSFLKLASPRASFFWVKNVVVHIHTILPVGDREKTFLQRFGGCRFEERKRLWFQTLVQAGTIKTSKTGQKVRCAS